MAQQAPERMDSARHDAEDFFLAAYALLGETGQSGVTVPALCERVGVTKGSFYHHFADLPDFVVRFAKRWQAWLTAIVDSYAAEPDPMKRIELVANSHFVAITGAEPAIRAWAHSEAALADAVRAVDAYGMPMALSTCRAATDDEPTVELLALLSTCTQIGLQQLAYPVGQERYLRVIATGLHRCLHLRTEFVWVADRLCVRVLGRSGIPVPRFAQPEPVPAAALGFQLDPVLQDVATVFDPIDSRGAAAFFRAAREILAERGSDAVTVQALCERLGVTKGSFHHHFGTFDGFLVAWANQWERAFDALLARYAAEPDPARRLTLMFQTVLSQPAPVEIVWRALARDVPVVRAVLERAERQVLRQFAESLDEVVGDSELAQDMAALGLSLAIGALQVQPPLDARTFAVLGLEWVRRCVGLPADLVLVDGAPYVAIGRPHGR